MKTHPEDEGFDIADERLEPEQRTGFSLVVIRHPGPPGVADLDDEDGPDDDDDDGDLEDDDGEGD